MIMFIQYVKFDLLFCRLRRINKVVIYLMFCTVIRALTFEGNLLAHLARSFGFFVAICLHHKSMEVTQYHKA